MSGKRTVSDEITGRIKARELIIPFVARIGPMVDRAVFLETVASQRSAPRSAYRREAAMLAEEAREDLRHLDLQVAEMPRSVASQNQIADARRALVAVADRFDRARTAL